MDSDRISKIIKHAGKLLKEVLTELFGDPEKEKEEKPRDESRNTGEDWTETVNSQDVALVPADVPVQAHW